MADDYHTWEGRSLQYEAIPFRAVLQVPMLYGGDLIGVLSVNELGNSERKYTEVDAHLLSLFAEYAASAVHAARLLQETQRRLVELEALYENGLAVGQLLEPRQIGERLIETFARHLSWHHVTIRLLRPKTDELELIAFNLPDLDNIDSSAVEERFKRLIHKVGQGLSGYAVQTAASIRTGQVHTHPQYISTQAGIESGLYMPLKIGSRVIGVISVESEKPDAFSEQDERLLATLATQAAIAFENARLYQAAQQEITERERAQAALRESEAHYRELADSITEIMFELDQDLNYSHWNKASELFSGITAQEAIGRSIPDLFGESEDQSYR
jgi:GAF domain-containing protein